MSMAHGLESRAPLLNPALIDFALALPDETRVGARGQTKTLLRLLCERHFGRGIARAAKQGFSIPIRQWLRTAGVDLLDDLLSPASVESLELLDPAPIAPALQDHRSGRRALGWELWGLMVLTHGTVAGSPPPRAHRNRDETTSSSVARSWRRERADRAAQTTAGPTVTRRPAAARAPRPCDRRRSVSAGCRSGRTYSGVVDTPGQT